MAQKPLVDSDEVRQSLGIMDHPDVLASIDRAIISAQIYFEEVLQTRLMKQSNTDNFKIDPQLIYIVPDGFYRLRLRNSLVRNDPALVITRYDTYRDLMTNNQPLVLDASKGDYYIDSNKGVVHVSQDIATVAGQYANYIHTPRYDYFFKVTYDSGVANKSEAPEWLKEAISAYIPGLLTQKQVTNRSDQAEKIFEQGKKYAFTLLEPYLRDRGFCFNPL